ncbi:MAG: twin-arginine translocase TatA/TatE family subunit [Bacteroidota bacterium]
MELTSIFAFLGSLGGSEMFLIFLAILLLFGAKKIPELARGLGKGIREFKDASREIKDELEEGLKEDKKTVK